MQRRRISLLGAVIIAAVAIAIKHWLDLPDAPKTKEGKEDDAVSFI